MEYFFFHFVSNTPSGDGFRREGGKRENGRKKAKAMNFYMKVERRRMEI